MVQTERKAPTVRDANRIASLLVAKFPNLEAIFLCGSVARGDADEWSDIDLVVVASEPDTILASLWEVLKGQEDRISLIYYPMSLFLEKCRTGDLFIAHLGKEGIALFDPRSLLQKVSPQVLPEQVDVSVEINAYLAKLAPYRDSRRFNNNFLFCLSHVYSIGKGIVMLGLAKNHSAEFNRKAAFERFAELNPDLAGDVDKVVRLRPFYSLVANRRPEPPPYSYENASEELRDAVAAVDRIANRVNSL